MDLGEIQQEWIEVRSVRNHITYFKQMANILGGFKNCKIYNNY